MFCFTSSLMLVLEDTHHGKFWPEYHVCKYGDTTAIRYVLHYIIKCFYLWVVWQSCKLKGRENPDKFQNDIICLTVDSEVMHYSTLHIKSSTSLQHLFIFCCYVVIIMWSTWLKMRPWHLWKLMIRHEELRKAYY